MEMEREEVWLKKREKKEGGREVEREEREKGGRREGGKYG